MDICITNEHTFLFFYCQSEFLYLKYIFYRQHIVEFLFFVVWQFLPFTLLTQLHLMWLWMPPLSKNLIIKWTLEISHMSNLFKFTSPFIQNRKKIKCMPRQWSFLSYINHLFFKKKSPEHKVLLSILYKAWNLHFIFSKLQETVLQLARLLYLSFFLPTQIYEGIIGIQKFHIINVYNLISLTHVYTRVTTTTLTIINIFIISKSFLCPLLVCCCFVIGTLNMISTFLTLNS